MVIGTRKNEIFEMQEKSKMPKYATGIYYERLQVNFRTAAETEKGLANPVSKGTHGNVLSGYGRLASVNIQN